jgi:5-methylcytosine-specific restriction endonuclease McrA
MITENEILSLLEKQGYRCALTGRALTPQTASIDHAVPMSRGGATEVGNLHVLHSDVNRAKGELTVAEFVSLCREVVAYQDGPPSSAPAAAAFAAPSNN